MSEVLLFAPNSSETEMIAKLISAGYLRPEQRNDRDANYERDSTDETGLANRKWR